MKYLIRRVIELIIIFALLGNTKTQEQIILYLLKELLEKPFKERYETRKNENITTAIIQEMLNCRISMKIVLHTLLSFAECKEKEAGYFNLRKL